MKDKLASIIVRTKNEQDWIGQCLELIKQQTYTNSEIIVVDTGSTDKTLDIIRHYPEVKLIMHREKYRPGRVLNAGCKAAKGEYLVFLSAHCLPVNDAWLESLIGDLADPMVAGVYGKQEPTDETAPFDKRDLILTFGLDRRVQWNDPFFHNANSVIKKKLWKELPFNEDVTNIEDRVWAASMQRMGYCIVYEPEARVFHYHGIHQKGCKIRLEGVNSILDDIESYITISDEESPPKGFKKGPIIAVIPFSEKIDKNISPSSAQRLLAATLKDLESNQFIETIYLLTDSPSLFQYVKQNHHNIKVPYLRKDSKDKTLLSVFQTFIKRQGIDPACSILIAEMIFLVQNRREYYVKICEEYLKTNHTSALWLAENYSSIFRRFSGGFHRLDEEIAKFRGYRIPFYEAIDGLGKIISVNNITKNYFHDANTLLMEKKDSNIIIQVYTDNNLDWLKHGYINLNTR